MVRHLRNALGLARTGDQTLKHLPMQTRALALLLFLSSLVLGCTGKPDGVEAVRRFDLQRYKGQWFEIMRLDHSFERGLSNVTATYTLRADGSVGVLNKGFDRKKCRWKEAEGRALFQGPSDTASLSVTFFWPFAGGYHVFALDQQDYSWAMIAAPSRDYLWILARHPNLDADIRNRLVGRARELSLPVDQLILVRHNVATCAPGG